MARPGPAWLLASPRRRPRQLSLLCFEWLHVKRHAHRTGHSTAFRAAWVCGNDLTL